MTHEIFQKEYFDDYEFYRTSEEQFRKHPTITKITTGFRYEGGKKPIWILYSAFQSEKEALSVLDEKTLIDTLNELKQDVLDAHFMEGSYFVRMIDIKIREIEKRNNGE